ncbi:DNA translocase FtsK [Bacillus shivajii]|uniref:DNA translocase FtsK n=1 Tax=Bacillus shivajii TaxID=1983719 RepID=UPI001CF9D3C3|nr:DNA translocase FtsK [Bacillus shivajii]UCZ52320.1 DNA translocase FtsK [Bacillus shivajii]
MNKRLPKLFSTLKGWLFPTNEEKDMSRYENDQIHNENEMGRKVPITKNPEAKVIHQYPKQGAFRFPLIEDDEDVVEDIDQRARRNVRSMNEYKTKQQEEKVEVKNLTKNQDTNDSEKVHSNKEKEKEKAKFQGVDFKPQETPSPIYGYQKTIKQTKIDEAENEAQRILYQYDRKEHDDPLPYKDVASASNMENDKKVDDEHEAMPEETEIQQDRQNEREYLNDSYNEPNDEEELHNEESNIKVENTQSLLKENKHLNEQSELQDDNEQTEPLEEQSERQYEQTELQEDHEQTELQEDHEQTELQEDHEQSKNKHIENRQLSSHQNKHKSNIVKKETKNHNKPVTPYNVLMLPSDKRKQEKRTKVKEDQYEAPGIHLLDIPPRKEQGDDEWLHQQAEKLNETFEYFHIRASVVHYTKGPSVTRFEIQPEPGVKVSKITNLTDDLKLSLAAKEIRIEAPIPGKTTVGIEVPNAKSEPVFLREILHSPVFQKAESPLTVALGMDISGEAVVTDLQKMPHGLIAGATGSGKSVCVNSILVSLLYNATPKDVRLLLIDPKMVELAPYNNVPHLAAPVINDPKQATEGLKWAVEEMERRYEQLAQTGARDIGRYNEKMKQQGKEDETLPYIVIIVDELADLMMVSPSDVESAICRIAQKARACGIHLLVATQRPSVDVITGLIKANIPTRIAFSVSSQADSRTILDSGGAERLLGRGDMLLLENGSSKPVRLQGTFVTDDEIDRVTEFVKKDGQSNFLFKKEDLQQQVDEEDSDDMFDEVCEFVVEQQAASTSLLQRHFRMGYNRAARLIDLLEAKGIVSPAKGSKPRDVYLTKSEMNEKKMTKGEI